MKSRSFIISLMFSFALVTPVISHAEPSVEIIDSEAQNISISVNASVIHITGANGQTLYVYNVAGVKVMSLKIDGADKHYDLNLPKGCYIVKIGKTVRKIAVK